eukprot:CAMPEP_0183478936 /NCGR_PEP_ID=MMETSP0370-20130417/170784_1 /TAXON_ID=268820 /ORGANISM="Peridinium aciculiferum, Strain PAER-2" /LENGTH=229 /DNA_ID=CAMNT_0025671917 /DNA_START=34 /DNA_END=720 /DNA_ORIENTATION=+
MSVHSLHPTTSADSAATNTEAKVQNEVARLLSPSEGGKADWGVLSPVSKVRLSWDVLAFMILMVDLWLTPFELIFLSCEATPAAFATIGIVSTLFWCADMCLNFTTGYIDKDRLVMNRGLSVRRYLHFWFWIDLVATIPFDLILWAAVEGLYPKFFSMARLAKISKVLKTVRFLKMFRALRAVRSMTWANHLMETYRPVAFFIKLLQVVGLLAMLSHVHGCLWVALQPA